MSNKDIVVTFEDENEIVIKLESKTFLNLQKKTVAPSTEEQVVRSDSGYEGLKEVIIEAVTSAIDNNIISSNIKKNVTILGVEGTLEPILQSKTASPSSNDQVITPDENYDGLSSVSIRAMHLEIFSITPRTYNQTLTPSSGYDAIGRVTINKVTSAIDSNITPENIKNGVTILGVEGTFDTPEYEGSYEITSNGTYATSGKKMTQDLVVNTAGDIIYGLKARCEYTMESLNDVNGIITEVVDGAFSAWNAWTTTRKNVLKSVYLPNATSIGQEAFKRNTGLTTVTLLKCTTIKTDAFAFCSKIETITLGANSVCSIAGTSAIPATSSHHITVYVPSDLITSYQNASNWSYLYNEGYIDFVAIS